jgi:hypothetical protein
MRQSQYQKTVAKLLVFGVPLVSMFLMTGSVTDPVNLTKFLILGAVGTAGLLLVLSRGLQQVLVTSKAALVAAGLFLLFSISAVIFSSSPLPQNLYGVYGRNTGFLAYFFLIGVMLCALTLANLTSFKHLFFGLFVTGQLMLHTAAGSSFSEILLDGITRMEISWGYSETLTLSGHSWESGYRQRWGISWLTRLLFGNWYWCPSL